MHLRFGDLAHPTALKTCRTLESLSRDASIRLKLGLYVIGMMRTRPSSSSAIDCLAAARSYQDAWTSSRLVLDEDLSAGPGPNLLNFCPSTDGFIPVIISDRRLRLSCSGSRSRRVGRVQYLLALSHLQLPLNDIVVDRKQELVALITRQGDGFNGYGFMRRQEVDAPTDVSDSPLQIHLLHLSDSCDPHPAAHAPILSEDDNFPTAAVVTVYHHEQVCIYGDILLWAVVCTQPLRIRMYNWRKGFLMNVRCLFYPL